MLALSQVGQIVILSITSISVIVNFLVDGDGLEKRFRNVHCFEPVGFHLKTSFFAEGITPGRHCAPNFDGCHSSFAHFSISSASASDCMPSAIFAPQAVGAGSRDATD
jgi:hypothetical protein